MVSFVFCAYVRTVISLQAIDCVLGIWFFWHNHMSVMWAGATVGPHVFSGSLNVAWTFLQSFSGLLKHASVVCFLLPHR